MKMIKKGGKVGKFKKGKGGYGGGRFKAPKRRPITSNKVMIDLSLLEEVAEALEDASYELSDLEDASLGDVARKVDDLRDTGDNLSKLSDNLYDASERVDAAPLSVKDEDFLRYINETLIPDLKENGRSEMAKDVDRLLALVLRFCPEVL